MIKTMLKGMNVKVVVGVGVVGLGLVLKDVLHKKELNKLNWKINSTNHSLEAIATAHNLLVDETAQLENRIDDLKKETEEVELNLISFKEKNKEKIKNVMEQVLDTMEDEVCAVYNHIEEVEKRNDE